MDIGGNLFFEQGGRYRPVKSCEFVPALDVIETESHESLPLGTTTAGRYFQTPIPFSSWFEYYVNNSHIFLYLSSKILF
jgi:hypothetical protein